MTASLASLNPVVTTNFAGQFQTTSDGYTQGQALADWSLMSQLRGGVLAASETLPMYPGVGVYENMPAAGSSTFVTPTVGRATNVTANTAKTLAGFSVFNNWVNGVNNPQSPVPTAATGMGVNFFRLGSGIMVPVACAPSLTSLDGSLTTPLVSWDFVGQQLAPYVAAYPANVLTGQTWSAGSVTFTTTTAHGVAVGDVFAISGSTPAGYNGVYTAITGTTGSTLVATLATNPGSSTAYGTLVAGGGALNVKISGVYTNGRIISYNATTNVATYATGTVALIQL